MKLNVKEPDDYLTNKIIELFDAYNEILLLSKPFHVESELGTKNTLTVDFIRGIIESTQNAHVFRTKREINRIQIPSPGALPAIGYQERTLQEEWALDNTI